MQNKYKLVAIVVSIVIISSLSGIAVIAIIFESQDDIVSGEGQIVYLSLEGGFYGIIAENGGKYDPINLPDEFKIDGLLVEFIAKILKDRGSFHMWGQIVELLSIKNLS